MNLCCSGFTRLRFGNRGCNCPSKCFCKFDPDELVPVARRKFVLGESTLVLMREAKTSHERDMVCVVSMLDVPDSMGEFMIAGRKSDSTCDVLACREALKRSIEKRIHSSDIAEKNVCFSPLTLRGMELAYV